MLLILAITAIFCLRVLGSRFTDFYNQNYKLSATAMDRRKAIQGACKNAIYGTIATEKDEIQSYIDYTNNELKILGNGLTKIKDNFPENQAQIDVHSYVKWQKGILILNQAMKHNMWESNLLPR